MEIDNEKWTRVVAKLIVDTRKRTIKWKLFAASDPTTSENSLAAIMARPVKIYLAEFNEQAFRLEIHELNALSSFGKPPGPTYKLSIAKSDGTVLRLIPITSGLFDLAQAIDDQLSQVDEFVMRYLDH
jgi:hypothetical protein